MKIIQMTFMMRKTQKNMILNAMLQTMFFKMVNFIYYIFIPYI